MIAARPFNPSRAYVIPTDVPQPQPHLDVVLLADLLRQDKVQSTTPMLLMTIDQHVVAFITRQVVLLHVLQTRMFSQHFLISFCSVCNSGAVFSPCIDSVPHTFTVGGMYNAMIFLRDQEAGSYWDHLTGVCIAGRHCDTRLTRLSNLLHVTAHQVVNMHPDAIVMTATLSAEEEASAVDEDAWRLEHQPEWSDGLARLLDQEDTRLPRLDMGLGVWAEGVYCYYPSARISAAGGALIDVFDGHRLLVYRMPGSAAPMALFTQAEAVKWEGKTLLLDDGSSVRDGLLYGAGGAVLTPDRPTQVYMRWFGFSSKFPGCTIYGRR
jgi:hypothetical protein